MQRDPRKVFRENGERQLRRPLPPYPHSNPVGLSLRSPQRGSRGLGSPVPSVTQTTHPSGPRQPVHTFLLHGQCLAVLVSAFMVLSFVALKTLPAGRFATTRQGRRALGLRS